MAKNDDMRVKNTRSDITPQTGGPAFHPEPGEFWTGLQFPLDLEELKERARVHRADEAFIERLGKMPNRTYNSAEEFRQDFGDDLENYGGREEFSPRTEAEYESDVETD